MDSRHLGIHVIGVIIPTLIVEDGVDNMLEDKTLHEIRAGNPVVKKTKSSLAIGLARTRKSMTDLANVVPEGAFGFLL